MCKCEPKKKRVGLPNVRPSAHATASGDTLKDVMRKLIAIPYLAEPSISARISLDREYADDGVSFWMANVQFFDTPEELASLVADS